MESFSQRLKRIAKENQDVLAMFEEYDRTHVFKRKVTYKQRCNFTLDADLVNAFRNYCNARQQKMSTVLEALIRGKVMAK